MLLNGSNVTSPLPLATSNGWEQTNRDQPCSCPMNGVNQLQLLQRSSSINSNSNSKHSSNSTISIFSRTQWSRVLSLDRRLHRMCWMQQLLLQLQRSQHRMPLRRHRRVPLRVLHPRVSEWWDVTIVNHTWRGIERRSILSGSSSRCENHAFRCVCTRLISR